jgi:outer membrane protein TolC
MRRGTSCGPFGRPAAAAASILLTAACGHFTPGSTISKSVAPSPAIPWTPPAEGRSPQQPVAKLEIPEEYTKPGTQLSLAQLVDVALRNNPRTREAWHFARAAAAEVGVQRSEFYPVVELDGTITRRRRPRSEVSSLSCRRRTGRRRP